MDEYATAPTSASGQLELIPEPTPDAPDADFSSENPDLLIPCRRATKVYINGYNQVVICQDRNAVDQDDEPAYCCFNPDSLMTLIDRLTDLAGIPSLGKPR